MTNTATLNTSNKNKTKTKLRQTKMHFKNKTVTYYCHNRRNIQTARSGRCSSEFLGERERGGKNSKTLFDKDCSLGSVKNLSNN